MQRQRLVTFLGAVGVTSIIGDWRPSAIAASCSSEIPSRLTVCSTFSYLTSFHSCGPAFSDAVTQAKAARLTFLERKFLAVKNGSEAATSIFALKNAGPQEWKEVRYENVEHTVNLDGISDEQLAAIALGRQAPMIDVTPASSKKLPKR